MTKTRRVLFGLFSVMLASSASAVTIHVPLDQPSVADGLAASAAGDTVLLADGLYVESGLHMRSGVVLRGASGSPEAVVLDADSLGSVMVLDDCEDGTLIEGITFTGGSDCGVRINGGAPEIDNCIMTGNTGVLGGGMVDILSAAVISNCLFVDNAASYGGGIACLQSSPTFYRCTIVENSSLISAGVYITAASPILDGCTIAYNGGPATDTITFLKSDPLVSNCLIAFNGTDATFTCSGELQPTFYCTNIYGNAGGDEICGSDGAGNISADPIFCDPGARDYSLYKTSPCLPENNLCGLLMGAFGKGPCNLPGEWVLTVPGDYATIGEALAAAADGDTIQVSAGVYPETFTLPGGLVLQSASEAADTWIDGGGAGTVVTIPDPGTREPSVLRGFTITGGAESGIRITGGAPRVLACEISGNACDAGGGLRIETAQPRLEDCVIADNTAGAGAAISCVDAALTALRCTIVRNTSVGSLISLDASTAGFEACILSANDAVLLGGPSASQTLFTCCDIHGNTPSDLHGGGDGGGNFSIDPQLCDPAAGDYHPGIDSPCLALNNDCGIRIGALDTRGCEAVTPWYHRVPYEHLTIERAMRAALPGDTILVYPGAYIEHLLLPPGMTVIGKYGAEKTVIDARGLGSPVTVQGRRDADGLAAEPAVLQGFTLIGGVESGLRIRFADPTILDCVIRGNSGVTGGGIYALESGARISGCRIDGNTAAVGGGGLHLDRSDLEIDGCVIAWNSTEANGGGLFCEGSSPALTDCVIYQNTAINGGGLYAYELLASPDLRNCTVTHNEAALHGSGLYFFSESRSVVDRCIVSYNRIADPIHSFDTARPVISCTNVYGNTFGDVLSGVDGSGNFSADPRYCNFYNDNFTLRADSPCLPEGNDCGVLIGALPQACSADARGEEPPQIDPSRDYATRLLPCAPNPFNPSTTVAFELERPGPVRVLIHDLRGRRVRTLVDEAMDRGPHERMWQGLDDAGRRVGSGVYFVSLDVGGRRWTERVALLK